MFHPVLDSVAFFGDSDTKMQWTERFGSTRGIGMQYSAGHTLSLKQKSEKAYYSGLEFDCLFRAQF